MKYPNSMPKGLRVKAFVTSGVTTGSAVAIDKTMSAIRSIPEILDKVSKTNQSSHGAPLRPKLRSGYTTVSIEATNSTRPELAQQRFRSSRELAVAIAAREWIS
jgi:hypothetical protein